MVEWDRLLKNREVVVLFVFSLVSLGLALAALVEGRLALGVGLLFAFAVCIAGIAREARRSRRV